MPWQLEIHHIDVLFSGDATLIIARETGGAPGVAPVVRSALIDGGRSAYSIALNNYLAQELGGNKLNVIVVTHYQDDHVGGIIDLLTRADPRYDRVRIYDQGWPNAGDAMDGNYSNYIRAINGLGVLKRLINYNTYCQNRVRVTYQVQADGAGTQPTTGFTTRIGPPAAPGVAGAVTLGPVNLPANWLLAAGYEEMLWADFAGTVAYPGAGVAPAGAPTMWPIAANRYVRTNGGQTTGPILGGADPKNAKCLGVEVRFGNFRYYVAGDIETPQENSIQQLLNNADDVPGRVNAIKVSHHGSNTATSRAFIDRLRPMAAFISCGTANSYFHPALATVNTLDGFPANPALHAPGIPPNRPVLHYLTGYQVRNPPTSRAGVAGFTAGDPHYLVPRRGHIVLTVTAAQSVQDRRGARYLDVEAAAIAAATNPNVPNPLDPATAALAAAGAASSAVSLGAAAAATEFLTIAGPASIGAAGATQLAVTNALNQGYNAALTALFTTHAASLAGAPGGAAAGAGAAAGTYAGGCGGPAIDAAVTWSLNTAGVVLATAQAAGAVAALQAGNALFSVRYWSMAAGGIHTITHF
ncbi:MAG TPA: MBL fold metallo-hydrolase [Streptosporangiaceae bacterium]|nr:MBL fold metallo-hydrolase [Streptosporangiaceae bacterium]